MREPEINMLHDTLRIVHDGAYTLNGTTIPLKHSFPALEEAIVYLPDDLAAIGDPINVWCPDRHSFCGHSCVNMDSYSLARKRYQEFGFRFHDYSKPILVLNLANPVHPGGGVRNGAHAQEEDLCRKSSLLVSLESEAAHKYYDYNRSLNTYMGSDAIILSPTVEIIKDENGNLLDEPVTVAVLTCAAPMIKYGLEGMTDEEYRQMFLQRITSMLKFSAAFGYKWLVLGAWGCGAFGNDAAVVSDLFRQALIEFRLSSLRHNAVFEQIDFAVLCKHDDYNFRQFQRNFEHFYGSENEADIENALADIRQTEIHLDAIRGCMIGGAAGDALGYAVEFRTENQIFAEYGPQGITHYQLHNGKARISDDTQMTLFTANTVLYAQTDSCQRGIPYSPHNYMEQCYSEWYMTQTMSW